MPILLTLLDGVRWEGTPVPGDRPQALLAALADAGRTVGTDRLVDLVWSEDRPANPGKALQVLVSRLRSTLGAGVVVTDGEGYRLDLPGDQVDAVSLRRLARRARETLGADPGEALRWSEEALAISVAPGATEGEGMLAVVRRRAAEELASARLVRARALTRTGQHAMALADLETAAREHPDDEQLLADLLRAEAAVRGAAAALDRFEAYRADLRDRLGSDPGSELQRLHRELLALDRPVREGLRYDASELLGRDGDLQQVTALLGVARVVSVMGPGGLGKTRLAHAVARAATQPVVHFVELVGITSPDDLVGEVGSALGVRDSVSGRRTLTPEQRADVRARIARQLDQAPTLLVLDNCEHLVEAVADLVAFLVATTRELRVLTTTRAPLAISAERVYLLPQLGTADAVALFCQRATAARPGVRLDDADVRAVVDRLDGLPLAIELAAAKVRVMTPAEIAARLDDRFGLLRGGDRSAPDRHRTLLAVIDWSWNLLAPREQRALRWLSTFHDGFTLDAAASLLGADPLETVGDLVEQSLLVVTDTDTGTRYRMLETVREFGRMQLTAARDAEEARAGLRRWAVGYAGEHGGLLFSPDQVEAMDALRREETNLADVLREAVGEPDPAAVAVLFSALGAFWTISGEHGRAIVLTRAIAAALAGWTPEPAIADRTRVALAIGAFSASMASLPEAAPMADQLLELGPSDIAALRALGGVVVASVRQDRDWVLRQVDDPDPVTAGIALLWLSHERENDGDPQGAIAAAERALPLLGEGNGPWLRSVLHSQLSGLHAQFGRVDQASEHARAALTALEPLGAVDDAIQARSVLAMAALLDGRPEEARRQVEELAALASPGTFGGNLSILSSRAQIALATGEVAEGLRLHRQAVEELRATRFPGADEVAAMAPWVIYGEATAVSAFAQHGEGSAGADLYDDLRAKLLPALDQPSPAMDVPVLGLLLFGVGAWRLLKGDPPHEDALRLLVLAERSAYHRYAPTMHWERMAGHAERLAPGLLAKIQAEYGERRGRDLLADARAVAERVS
ncbi:MAG TPA: BTAD domain-containing putative transcriptional regulator [Nocardioides sp.]|nr:BTAD domain-containing putative transcriptional regulator [Nocardioides sp.]